MNFSFHWPFHLGHDGNQQPTPTPGPKPPPVQLNYQGFTLGQLQSRVDAIKILIADYQAQALDPTIMVDDPPPGATKAQKLAINAQNVVAAQAQLAVAQADVAAFPNKPA